jgi:hypothetical protein
VLAKLGPEARQLTERRQALKIEGARSGHSSLVSRSPSDRQHIELLRAKSRLSKARRSRKQIAHVRDLPPPAASCPNTAAIESGGNPALARHARLPQSSDDRQHGVLGHGKPHWPLSLPCSVR